MFGNNRFRAAIRRHAGESAEEIKNHMIAELTDFQGDAPQEDDMTLVVVKLLQTLLVSRHNLKKQIQMVKIKGP